MKKYLIIFLLFIYNISFTQEKIVNQILDDMFQNTNMYDNSTINFLFNYKNQNLDINTDQEGTIIIQGGKFNLQIDNQLIINDGITQWIYLKDVNELQITNNDPKQNTMNLNALFEISREDFKANYIGISKENTHIIELIPKESDSFIKMQLNIDNKNEIKKIIIDDKQGGQFTYLITSLQTNSEILPFYFNSKNYNDIEIIDLR